MNQERGRASAEITYRIQTQSTKMPGPADAGSSDSSYETSDDDEAAVQYTPRHQITRTTSNQDGAPSRSATPLHHTTPSAPTHPNRNRQRKLRDRNHFPKKSASAPNMARPNSMRPSRHAEVQLRELKRRTRICTVGEGYEGRKMGTSVEQSLWGRDILSRSRKAPVKITMMCVHVALIAEAGRVRRKKFDGPDEISRFRIWISGFQKVISGFQDFKIQILKAAHTYRCVTIIDTHVRCVGVFYMFENYNTIWTTSRIDEASPRGATPLHHMAPRVPTHPNHNRQRKLRDRNHFFKKS